jgi:hypothetical protein
MFAFCVIHLLERDTRFTVSGRSCRIRAHGERPGEKTGNRCAGNYCFGWFDHLLILSCIYLVFVGLRDGTVVAREDNKQPISICARVGNIRMHQRNSYSGIMKMTSTFLLAFSNESRPDRSQRTAVDGASIRILNGSLTRVIKSTGKCLKH